MKVKLKYSSNQYIENQREKRRINDIFWIYQFFFTKFPPFSLDDLIVISVHEKLTDHIKSWHLHLQTMPQNFRKIASSILGLLPFLSLNDPIHKNAFGQFGWFSYVESHINISPNIALIGIF